MTVFILDNLLFTLSLSAILQSRSFTVRGKMFHGVILLVICDGFGNARFFLFQSLFGKNLTTILNEYVAMKTKGKNSCSRICFCFTYHLIVLVTNNF